MHRQKSAAEGVKEKNRQFCDDILGCG